MPIASYLKLARPVNSIMTGLGIVFATLLYNKWRPEPQLLLIGFLTGFLGTASSMIINDVVDKEVDAINKPWKPIPSGKADPRKALVLSISFLVLAIGVNALVNTLAILVATIYGLVAYTYSLLRRYWWSHFLVAFSTTAPITYGYVLANTPHEHLLLTILFSTTIFTATLGREIVKAAMDIEGDQRQGYVTIPIKYGIEKARKIILLTGLAAPTLGILTGILTRASIAYHILMGLTSIIYGYYMFKAYKHVSDKNTLEKTRKKTLAAMMLGLTAFLLSKP